MTSPIERAREAATLKAAAVLKACFEFGGARPVRDIVGEILAEYDASIAAEGMVLVPKPTLESLSWEYDASHMIYFCPWCQQTGSAEPAVHSPDCGLAAMIAAASQGDGT